MVAFVRHGDRAGLRAPVPTCPGWKVRHLAAHQGMVHRWATGQLRGGPVDSVAIERIGMNADDPLDWLRDGALDLVKAIMQASASDQDVPPSDGASSGLPPRHAWARQQCHETSIHAVDAFAAALGRAPIAAEVDWITDEVALDGIEALLTDIVASGQTAATLARYPLWPQGAESGWLLEVGPDPARLTRLTEGGVRTFEADTLLAGSPVDAYLSLWNRSSHPLPTGWEEWTERFRVQWGDASGRAGEPAGMH